jgi:predicted transcriptional regulator
MQNKPFMVRLRPSTRELLDKAADDQRRSRASIIDELIRDALTPRYADVNERLQRLFQGGQR